MSGIGMCLLFLQEKIFSPLSDLNPFPIRGQLNFNLQ